MGKFENKNAEVVLQNLENLIIELDSIQGKSWSDISTPHNRYIQTGFRRNNRRYAFNIKKVYDELSIFDWWNYELSLSQLKQMQSFLKTAISLGFTGYVCFKVGARGCSHGMWAAKEESENGYSPDCDTLFHSFRSGDNYYDVCLNSKWYEGYANKYKLADIKKLLAESN